MVRRFDWPQAARLSAWILAIGLFFGTIIFALLAFELVGPEPPKHPIADLADSTFRFFRDSWDVWPLELISRLLFLVGFLGLALLGVTLMRSRRMPDLQAFIAAGPFVLAGVLGIVAELLTIGVKQVAIQPEYCDCKYFPEQIIARGQALGVAENAEEWMLYGLFLLSAIGLYALGRASIGGERAFDRRWGFLSFLIAILYVVGLVGLLFDLSDLYDLTVAIGGGVLVPIWAIWLGRQLNLDRAAAVT